MCRTLQDTEILNTAVLTGKRVMVPVRTVAVEQDGLVTDVSEFTDCQSTNEDILKVGCSADLFRHITQFRMLGALKHMNHNSLYKGKITCIYKAHQAKFGFIPATKLISLRGSAPNLN